MRMETFQFAGRNLRHPRVGQPEHAHAGRGGGSGHEVNGPKGLMGKQLCTVCQTYSLCFGAQTMAMASGSIS